MEKLNKRALNKGLKKLAILSKDYRLSFFKKITSTFNAKNNGIVAAAFQSGGKGRLERTFLSPKGGIYLSILHKVVPLVTIKTAVGVMAALEQKGFFTSVKWVNDIFINKGSSDISTEDSLSNNQKTAKQAIDMQKQGKVCGILVKQRDSQLTIGIGINYAPKELPLISAARMYSHTKGINDFAVLLIKSVLDSLTLSDKAAIDYYTKRLRGLGSEVKLPNGSSGIIKGIGKNGQLLAMQEEKEISFYYGDIL